MIFLLFDEKYIIDLYFHQMVFLLFGEKINIAQKVRR
jgi:hypothetical protein